jgi:hypothetical protein
MKRHPPEPPTDATAQSFLLRVRRGPDGPRYAVQDLRTGERRQFASPGELQRWLEACSAAGLR